MASVDFIDRSEVDDGREQRHCPQCGSIYRCKPRWRNPLCPACNGKRISQIKANRRADTPPAILPDPIPAEMSELEREVLAMTVAGRCLEPLGTAGRNRVLTWLWARYDTESNHV